MNRQHRQNLVERKAARFENSQSKDSQKSILRTLKYVFGTVLVLSIFGIASPVFAAYHTYANNVPTGYGIEQTSSVVYNITGGRVESNVALNDIFLRIKTFAGHPGYTVIAQSTGSSPGWVTVGHQMQTAAYSGCSWVFPYDVGPINLTCQYQN